MASAALLLALAPAQAEVAVVETYGISLGQEVDNLVPVDIGRLIDLLPPGYTPVSAAQLGVGRPDQGLVVFVNFRGFDPTIGRSKPRKQNRVAIDITVLVAEPAEAAEAGLNLPGAFHFYTLAMVSDDAPYVGSLKMAGMPIEFEPDIVYQREIDDATGVGNLTVEVPTKKSPFKSFNPATAYSLAPNALDAVFWFDGRRGKTALHFHVPVYRQSNIFTSQLYLQPNSRWATLLEGGGLGPCPADPETGFTCLNTPSLNLRFDQGDIGRLFLFNGAGRCRHRAEHHPECS